jgi:hypothetical protein
MLGEAIVSDFEIEPGPAADEPFQAGSISKAVAALLPNRGRRIHGCRAADGDGPRALPLGEGSATWAARRASAAC